MMDKTQRYLDIQGIEPWTSRICRKMRSVRATTVPNALEDKLCKPDTALFLWNPRMGVLAPPLARPSSC